MAPAAFIPATPLKVSSTTTAAKSTICPRMSADEVIDKYYPVYRRYRAPTIVVYGDYGVSLSMAPIESYADVDKDTAPLLDYSDPSDFVPDKPVPPSAISWPSGDGRSDPDFVGVAAKFNQPNLRIYGPFPDFFKRSCDG